MKKRKKKPLEEYVFFLDNDSSSKSIIKTLKNEGLRIVCLKDRFKADADDEEWLPEIGVRGWVLLSRNKRIRYNPRQKDLLLRYSVRAFFLTSRKNLTGDQMAEIFLKALNGIHRYLQKYPGPFIVKIMSDASLIPWLGSCVKNNTQ